MHAKSQQANLADLQVHIYAMGQSHQLFGLVRASVLDNNDQAASGSFLDSDGEFANNEERDFPKDLPKVNDNQWHMITVTTQKSMKPGYDLYIDGILRATVKKPVGEGLEVRIGPLHVQQTFSGKGFD